jgi:hypothetical protein
MLHIAGLSKAKQQHVRQVVGWLAAPEGGGHVLSVTDGPGAWLVSDTVLAASNCRCGLCRRSRHVATYKRISAA